MAGCLLVTLPLEFLLGARVYRRPVRVVRVLLPVVMVFMLWDALAIARGHWNYSDQYTTGWNLPLGIPVEELVFFVVIPLCALLTFGAVRQLLHGHAELSAGPGEETGSAGETRSTGEAGDA